MRKVVLDTETTGIHFGKPIYQDHYIIEIGAIELIDRKPRETFQRYIKAPRASTPESLAVHGITQDFLKNSPSFKEISQDLCEFIQSSELIIHNAPFDLAFLNAELSRSAGVNPIKIVQIEDICAKITDTLRMARTQFPNRKNSLDALCQRFNISNAHRSKHGALVDSELLMHVYLALTGGQRTFLFLDSDHDLNLKTSSDCDPTLNAPLLKECPVALGTYKIAHASKQELQRHEQCLIEMQALSESQSTLWIISKDSSMV